MKESWKPVVGMATYLVSDAGNVAASDGTPLKQERMTKGYRRVWLRDGAVRRRIMVHRLVLDAFVGPQPSALHQCNHRDGAKSNNRASNLEWVTPSGNAQHAADTGLSTPPRGEKQWQHKLRERDIIPIRRMHGKLTSRKVAEKYGVRPVTIRAVWAGINWRHVS